MRFQHLPLTDAITVAAASKATGTLDTLSRMSNVILLPFHQSDSAETMSFRPQARRLVSRLAARAVSRLTAAVVACMSHVGTAVHRCTVPRYSIPLPHLRDDAIHITPASYAFVCAYVHGRLKRLVFLSLFTGWRLGKETSRARPSHAREVWTVSHKEQPRHGVLFSTSDAQQ